MHRSTKAKAGPLVKRGPARRWWTHIHGTCFEAGRGLTSASEVRVTCRSSGVKRQLRGLVSGPHHKEPGSGPRRVEGRQSLLPVPAPPRPCERLCAQMDCGVCRQVAARCLLPPARGHAISITPQTIFWRGHGCPASGGERAGEDGEGARGGPRRPQPGIKRAQVSVCGCDGREEGKRHSIWTNIVNSYFGSALCPPRNAPAAGRSAPGGAKC